MSINVIQTTESYNLPIDMSKPRTAIELRREVYHSLGAANGAKSSRRPPHKTTDAQKRILLAEFEKEPNPSADKRDELAKKLNVERRIIKNWFSNQRALRRKTGQGYRGWLSGSSQSGDERDTTAMDVEEYDEPTPSVPATISPQTTGPSTPDSSYPPSPVAAPISHHILRATSNYSPPPRPLLPKPSYDAAPPSHYTTSYSVLDDRTTYGRPFPFSQKQYSSWDTPLFRHLMTTSPPNISLSSRDDTTDSDESDSDEPQTHVLSYPTSAIRSSLTK